jgi:fructose-bisphosphate aldolase class I
LACYGTKERSVINSPTAKASPRSSQQFEVGLQVLAGGLMPMLEPEVNIKSETRAECDAILLDELLKQLDRNARRRQGHAQAVAAGEAGEIRAAGRPPRVLRVVALSGGYKRPEACVELAKNRGIIASASAARCSKTCVTR